MINIFRVLFLGSISGIVPPLMGFTFYEVRSWVVLIALVILANTLWDYLALFVKVEEDEEK